MLSKCYVCRCGCRFSPYEVRVKEEAKKTAYYVCSPRCLASFAAKYVGLEAETVA